MTLCLDHLHPNLCLSSLLHHFCSLFCPDWLLLGFRSGIGASRACVCCRGSFRFALLLLLFAYLPTTALCLLGAAAWLLFRLILPTAGIRTPARDIRAVIP